MAVSWKEGGEQGQRKEAGLRTQYPTFLRRDCVSFVHPDRLPRQHQHQHEHVPTDGSRTLSRIHTMYREPHLTGYLRIPTSAPTVKSLTESARHQRREHTQTTERALQIQVRLPGVEEYAYVYAHSPSTSLRLLAASIIRSLCAFLTSRHFPPYPPVDMEQLRQSQATRY